MKYKDLIHKHIKGNGNDEALYVSFSAWNPKGHPRYFGEKFFISKGLEAFLISQNGTNHWWQTSEMYEIAEYVKERSIKSGKKVVLYGSSMGGYAVCHFRELFQSDYAIAIAPQIFIDKTIHDTDTRWKDEINLLQTRLMFNEVVNLNTQTHRHLHIYYDPIHKLDREHIELYKKLVKSSHKIHAIKVPYTNHDVARALNKAKVLSKIVTSYANKSTVMTKNELVTICSNVYEYDMRTFFNFFRHLDFKNDQKVIDSSMEKFEYYYSQIERMDFGSLYMAAESLMKLGRFEEAINLSLKSIETYSYNFLKPAPDYLRNKFKYIVKKSIQSKDEYQ